MTFKNIAIKNFISHIRRYLSYLICSSFTIMVFFIYSTLIFNKSFMEYSKETEFIMMVQLGIISVLIFSIFFINYAHNAFIKSRSSEFALLMTLGLTKKNISRMIWIENIVILLSSLVIGLLSGALFSRLFFLIISELIKEVSLNYELDYTSFFVTLIVFVGIYGIAIIFSRKTITKLSIVQLMKKEKEGPKEKGNLLMGVIGIILFIGALVMVLFMAPREGFSDKGYMYLVYAGIAFFSMYLIISQMGSLLLQYLRRNKKRYYKHLLGLSEIEYSFTQNKKILFILSLLSAMIIFFVASPFSLFSISKEIAEGTRNADLEYIELMEVNTIEATALNMIVKQGETSLVKERMQEFLILSYEEGEKVIVKPVISETLYRQLNEESLPINQGEILQVVTTWMPGYDEFKNREAVALIAGDVSREFKVGGKIFGKGVSLDIFPSNITLVLKEEDYNGLRKEIANEFIGKIHLYDFENWEKTGTIIHSLREKLQNKSDIYPIGNTYEGYKTTKRMFSLMIFITSFMGLLFFISAGSILIFKQYGDMEHFKKIYKRLSQIGLTKKEIMKIHATSQKVIYFTPLIFGVIIGYAFIYMTTYMMGGGDMVATFFKYSTFVTILYFVIQLIYYKVSLRRFKISVIQKTLSN